MAYSVGYVDTQGIYGGCTEVTEVSGTGMEVVPNSRTVGYRYTELTEVSGTGIEFVPDHTEVSSTVLEAVPNHTKVSGIGIEAVPKIFSSAKCTHEAHTTFSY